MIDGEFVDVFGLVIVVFGGFFSELLLMCGDVSREGVS